MLYAFCLYLSRRKSKGISLTMAEENSYTERWSDQLRWDFLALLRPLHGRWEEGAELVGGDGRRFRVIQAWMCRSVSTVREWSKLSGSYAREHSRQSLVQKSTGERSASRASPLFSANTVSR